jgi:putative endonuclease
MDSPYRERSFFVYIMTNRSKTLYVGVTNNLQRRVWEHKHGIGSEFCKQYKLDRLVYAERFQYVSNAIDREKQIKGWLRIKKIALIVSQNPTWSDLSAEWYVTSKPQGA